MNARTGHRDYAWIVVILLVAFLVRSIRLTHDPLWLDEGWHIFWAQRVVEGDLFIAMPYGKTLYPILISLFNPTGPEAPFVGRYVSVLFGVLGTGCAIGLANRIHQRAGLTAGLLYALLPLAVLHERQALTDPLMAGFAALVITLTYVNTFKPAVWRASLIGLFLWMAVMTKLTGAVNLLIPLSAAFILQPVRNNPRFLKSLLVNSLSTVLALILIGLTFYAASQSGQPPGEDVVNALAIIERISDPIGRVELFADVASYGVNLWHYTGPIFLLLVAASLLQLTGRDRNKWRNIAYVAVPGILFAAPIILVPRPAFALFARYLTGTAVSLTILAAIGCEALLSRTSSRIESILRPAVLLIMLGHYVFFDAQLLRSVQYAPLAANERAIYHAPYTSDKHIQAVADLIHAQSDRAHIFVDGTLNYQLSAYHGPRSGLIIEPTGYADLAISALADPDAQVFYVTAQAISGEYQLESIANWEDVSLYRVAGVTSADIANQVAARRGPDPTLLDQNYAAVASMIRADNRAWVYPSAYADPFNGITGHQVRALEIERWPLSPSTVAGILSEPTSVIEIVLIDEAQTDSHRIILSSLYRGAFFIEESWSGYVHYLRFITPPEGFSDSEALNAQFGDGIRLNRCQVFDQTPSPGDVVRVSMEWVSTTPANGDYKVFVHLVNESGDVITQRDAIPGNGLLPTTGWEVDVPVVDQFTLTIPPDTAPGTYTLRVGLYDPASGIRLALLDSDDQPIGDFVVVGTIDVQGSE